MPSNPRNYHTVCFRVRGHWGSTCLCCSVLVLVFLGLASYGSLWQQPTQRWVDQGQMSEVPLLAWLQAYPMIKALHCFQSTSCPYPPHWTTIDPLTYHMKLIDVVGATLGRVTGSPCPRMATVARDQPRALHLTSGYRTLIHVKVHCLSLQSGIGISSEEHNG